jgi:toxin-antitoxin system PIN domain toxin
VSFAVDANLLLYASDAGSPHSRRAAAFLADRAAGREVFCLAWTTIMTYLRIATHHAIFTDPLSPEEAGRNIDALLHLPHVRVLAEEEGFWELYREVSRPAPVRGNLVPDAHLAALLRQHGVRTLYTNDTDFRKFKFLDVRNPLEEASA